MPNQPMDKQATREAAKRRTITEYRTGVTSGDYFKGDDEGALRVGFASGYDHGFDAGLAAASAWVPVEQGLPHDAGYYFVTATNGDEFTDIAYFDDKEFIFGDVIAWMPIRLPAPFGGE